MRGVWREGEEAVGIVREGAVGVEGVVPVVESCKIEVYTPDDSVAGIVTAGEGEDIARVEDRHRGGGRGADPMLELSEARMSIFSRLESHSPFDCAHCSSLIGRTMRDNDTLEVFVDEDARCGHRNRLC